MSNSNKKNTAPCVKHAAILIIDDDQDVAEFMKVHLLNLGCEHVQIETNALNAKKALSENHIDLMILDINMPKFNGVEIITALSAQKFSGGLCIFSDVERSVLRAIRKITHDNHVNLLNIIPKSQFKISSLEETLHLYKRDICEAQKKTKKTTTLATVTASDIEVAIDNDEFFFVLMPLVRFDTAKIESVEFAARWQHPVHGELAPNYFIDIINSDVDLAIKFNYYALDNVLQLIPAIQQQFPTIRFAINWSVICFHKSNCIQRIVANVAKYHIDPSLITIEITEDSPVSARGVTEALTQLYLAGFNTSVDDFGVGHSNLSKLYTVPFKELKLDMQFVQLAKKESCATKITTIVVNIAKTFEITSVAEGVEDEELWHLMKKEGFDLAQGYFVSRPIPPASLYEWYQSWQDKIKRKQINI